MKNRSVDPKLIPFIFYALIVAASLPRALFASDALKFSRVVLVDILLALVFTVAYLVISLVGSLKITIYSYRNIGYIAGILFVSSVTVMLSVFVFSCFFSEELSLPLIFSELVALPRRFSYYALFVLFAVFVPLFVSNIALIRHEGKRLTNLLSILLAVFCFGGTFGAYFISDLLRDKVFMPDGQFASPLHLFLHIFITMFLLLVLAYFECVFVGSAIMGFVAAKQVPKYDKDYIIILGCSIDKRGGLLPLLKGRVNRAVRFAWEQEIATGKSLKYVPSGGQGPNEIMSEGSAMELYLLSRGAENDEVFPEKESTSTYENMAFSKKIIDKLDPCAKIAFATTNYHMLRSGIIARMAGIDAEGIAGDTKWYFWPNGFMREFFGILALNKKTHIIISVALAAISAILGLTGCFIGM